MTKQVDVGNKTEKEHLTSEGLSPEALYMIQQLSHNALHNRSINDEVSLKELWRCIWAGKITIILISFLFAIISIFFAISKPDVYKASILLAPASSEKGAGSLSGLAGQFGGLAGLAGINLGAGSSDKTALALEVMKSRAFIEKFITKYELLVPIMAVEKWDRVTNKLIVDKELYDEGKDSWVREVSPPQAVEPSLWEAYNNFSKLISISKDKSTSLITIDIQYFSPEVAQQWLTWIVEEVNTFMREQDELEAKNSIIYLTSQLEKTEIANMETVFYQLIEEQTKNMMLTQVNSEYVLKTIDPAQVPDIKDSPKRALIVILGTILGGLLSIIIVLIRYFTNNPNTAKPNGRNLT